MDNYESSLGIEILRADTESAEARIKVRKELTDGIGHMPGGIYTCLADACGTAAANAGKAFYVTQNCSLQFYASTELSEDCLFAKATIRHRGSRTCIAAVELYHEDGTVAADGQFSYSKVSE